MRPPLKLIWIVTLGAVVLGVGFVGALAIYSMMKVPNFSVLRSSVDLDIKLADGQDSTRLVGPKAPGWVSLENISDYALMAVIASEDTTFYSHKGVDLHELREAIKKDIREKRWARGASTLTQQVVKNVFLSQEKSLWRKFREIFWAAELEKELSKQEILCFYMNMAELGPGIYGIGQGATYYFGVVPARLSVREAAFLTMLLPSPRKYHAYFARKTLTPWARKRVEHIIETMYGLGLIDEQARDRGMTESLWGNEGGEGLDDSEILGEPMEVSTESVMPDQERGIVSPDPETPPGETPAP